MLCPGCIYENEKTCPERLNEDGYCLSYEPMETYQKGFDAGYQKAWDELIHSDETIYTYFKTLYECNYEQFLRGNLSKEEWEDYCWDRLNKIAQMHEKVMSDIQDI